MIINNNLNMTAVHCVCQASLTQNVNLHLYIRFITGYWGKPTFSSAIFVAMIAGVITSVIESIGDYYTCARIAGAHPPPAHAINRGILHFCYLGISLYSYGLIFSPEYDQILLEQFEEILKHSVN